MNLFCFPVNKTTGSQSHEELSWADLKEIWLHSERKLWWKLLIIYLFIGMLSSSKSSEYAKYVARQLSQQRPMSQIIKCIMVINTNNLKMLLLPTNQKKKLILCWRDKFHRGDVMLNMSFVIVIQRRNCGFSLRHSYAEIK